MHQEAIDIWRAAGAGFFKVTKTARAVPLEEGLPIEAEMVKAVASA